MAGNHQEITTQKHAELLEASKTRPGVQVTWEEICAEDTLVGSVFWGWFPKQNEFGRGNPNTQKQKGKLVNPLNNRDTQLILACAQPKQTIHSGPCSVKLKMKSTVNGPFSPELVPCWRLIHTKPQETWEYSAVHFLLT